MTTTPEIDIDYPDSDNTYLRLTFKEHGQPSTTLSIHHYQTYPDNPADIITTLHNDNGTVDTTAVTVLTRDATLALARSLLTAVNNYDNAPHRRGPHT